MNNTFQTLALSVVMMASPPGSAHADIMVEISEDGFDLHYAISGGLEDTLSDLGWFPLADASYTSFHNNDVTGGGRRVTGIVNGPLTWWVKLDGANGAFQSGTDVSEDDEGSGPGTSFPFSPGLAFQDNPSGGDDLYLPEGFLGAGNVTSSTLTAYDHSFASMGWTPGTVVASIDLGGPGNQIVFQTVPEPSGCVFGLLAMLLGFSARRRPRTGKL